MRKCRHTGEASRLNIVTAAVAACFASGGAFANPTGPAVANGQVMFHQQGNLLQITNSPNAIINWQSFSIGVSEITRFLQQSGSSAVLNRVITQNPSSILGALQSNGRVFLINPNGILFGPGSQVDVAGLVASTLNLSDADFLGGRLRFTEEPGAGSVINQGAINAASGGQVYLVGPAVKNEGVITSPQGEVVLAAGKTVELVEPGTPNLRVEITAPDNEAVNLGQIAADAGRVGIYAGLVHQSGTVQANTAQVTEDGRIVLKATKGATLEAGSVTAATGVKGGNVTVETETGTIQVGGAIDASGSAAGGSINLAVTGDSGAIDLGTGLNAGNAAINVSGPGHTMTLDGDMVTAGAPISIDDSVKLGAPASITLDTTNSGAVASGANITITGAIDDDAEGSSGLVLNAGATGINNVGGAIGGTTPIASLATNGNVTFLSSGVVTTTGDQAYNSPSTFSPGAVAIHAGGDVEIRGNLLSGPQSINATGSITVTPGGPGSVSVSASGSQTVTAGAALNVEGAASGSNRFAQIIASGDQNISAPSINIAGGGGTGNFAQIRHLDGASGGQTLTVNGGDLVLTAGNGGANNRADIRGAADQSITVIGGGELSLEGGAAGANNQARIRHEASGGDQTINVAGGEIVISGGGSSGIPPDTGNNFARIEHRGPGNQTVIAHMITVNGGSAGVSNFAGIQAAHQSITTTGDVTLTGGAGSITGARIGGFGAGNPTDLVLNVGGDLTLSGGSETDASLGSNRFGGAPTDINVTAFGDITLNPGVSPGADSRIGSPAVSVAGGDIRLNSLTGNIALNSAPGMGASFIRTLGDVSLTAHAVTQGSDSAIQANQLTTETSTGTSLGGSNQVTRFNATNFASGDVIFTNTSPLLTVTGVSNFGGPLTLGQAGDLTLTGGIFSGSQLISATGNIFVVPSSSAVVNASGPQTINAGGGVVVQSSALGDAQITASGGQAIEASYIEVTAQEGRSAFISNFGSGDQTLTTHAANAQGEGIAVRSEGGVALIDQQAFGFGQSVSANDADYVRVIGEGGPAQISTTFGANQSIALQGAGLNALEVGSPTATGSSLVVSDGQTIMAGLPGQQGSIVLQGGGSGGGAPARILGRQSQDLAAADISVTGGSGGTGNFADILQAGGGFNQNVMVRDGGTLLLQGGVGAGNFARIRNNGANQDFNFTSGGALMLTGGSGVSGNFAQINANNGSQSITGGPVIELTGGTGGIADDGNRAQLRARVGTQTIDAAAMTITGGANGVSNGANVQAPHQNIRVAGNLALEGKGSASGAVQGGAARLGAPGGGALAPTDLTLDVGGNVTLKGGDVATALIGSSTLGGTAANYVSMTVGGDVTLNAGNGNGARIGARSSTPVGGDISVVAVGDIALNSLNGVGTAIRTLDNVSLEAKAITEGPNSAIVAGSLATHTDSGAMLVGANQLANYHATNSTGGALALFNSSPLLTVNGISQAATEPLTIDQSGIPGDLVLKGTITSGPQNISATGTISVVPASPAIVQAFGQQIITAGEGLIVQGKTGGSDSYARITSTGAQVIKAGELVVAGGDGTNNFAEVSAPEQSIEVSGNVSLTGGTGQNAGARIGGLDGLSPTPTNLVLNAGGNVSLTGGNGTTATIGSPASNVVGGAIVVSSIGDTLLNSGAEIRTTGNVALNATGPGSKVIQAPASVIQADQLSVMADGGAILDGANQLSLINFPQDISLSHVGDLVIATPLKGSGNISLSATGDITLYDTWIVADNSVTINGKSLRLEGLSSGALIWAGNGFDATVGGNVGLHSTSAGPGLGGWTAIVAEGESLKMYGGDPHHSMRAFGVGLLDRIAGHGPVNISAGSVTMQGGSKGGSFAAITGGPINIGTDKDFSIAGGSGFGAFGWVLSSQDVNLTVGGKLRLNSGSGLFSFARIQTVRPTSKINIYFPNLSDGGYYVDGVSGAYRHRLSGFYTGPAPAKRGKRLITTYGH